MKITKRQLRRIIKEEKKLLRESPTRFQSLASDDFIQALKGDTAIKEELQEDANAEQYELQNNAKIQQAIYDLEDRVMPVLYGTDLEPMVNSLHKAMYRKVSGR